MNKNIGIALAIVAVAILAIVAFANRDGNEPVTQSPTPAPAPAPAPNPTPTPAPVSILPKTVEVVISETVFSPAQLTVKKGDTVKFVNSSTKNRWPASAPHPTHTDYPEFDPKQAIAPGASWSFTFDKVGTWKYHDHLQPTVFGTITVTE